MNKPFAKRFNAPRLSPEEARRQGEASRRAIEVLKQPADVIAFLNTHDDRLGGRPIDIAVASAGGLEAVEAALTLRGAAVS